MYKIYISYDNSVKFLAYKEDGKNTLLTKEEISTLKKVMSEKSITDVKEYPNSMSVRIGDFELTFDNIEVFMSDNDLRSFGTKIVKYIEKQKLNSIKEYLPKYYVPTINRKKKNKWFVPVTSLALGAALTFGMPQIARDVKINNDKDNDDKKEENEQILILEETPKPSAKIEELIQIPTTTQEIDEIEIETNVDNCIEFAFDYVDEPKFQNTIDYFGSAIANFSKRYGVPYDLCCRFITQERPNVDKNGNVKNPCQLTNFVGVEFDVPVYDEFGITNNYDHFKVTQNMIDDITTNIQIGIAYLRYSINQNDSLLTGLFCYNQGPFSLYVATDYFGFDVNDYKGDENAIKARDLIVKYYKLANACKYYQVDLNDYKGKVSEQDALIANYYEEASNIRVHGDPNYLENVFRYASEDRNNIMYEYFTKEGKRVIEIINTLEYNKDLSEGYKL